MEICSDCGYPVETTLESHDDEDRPGLLTCIANRTHYHEDATVLRPRTINQTANRLSEDN
jgi:hypothetical protein